MTKLIVAVSGGVDSVVLLDMLVNNAIPSSQLIVAHFDHGIRADSAEDAEFVEGLAKKYGLPFETKREELGPKTSEEKARARRYGFLRSLAKKHQARIVTAHHMDDVIETIAINLTRGTGWRGLAAMDSDIVRPLVDMTKDEIIKYAKSHKLKWREDATNQSDKYLRNRIRTKTMKLDLDDKLQILSLWSQQKYLKSQIDQELKKLLGGKAGYSRYFFTHINDQVGQECIRFITQGRLTRPQQTKLLHAIKTAAAGKTIEAGSKINVHFTSRNFKVELLK
jgi:tRNA(Ile)-lysidine synthetase-like protein